MLYKGDVVFYHGTKCKFIVIDIKEGQKPYKLRVIDRGVSGYKNNEEFWEDEAWFNGDEIIPGFNHYYNQIPKNPK